MNRYLLALLLTALTAPALHGQQPVQITNPSFEAPDDGVPVGWFFQSPGFEARSVAGSAAAGERALRLRVVDPTAGQVGSISQSVDATSLRGKRIRLRAQARVPTAAPGTWTGLWLRVERPDRAPGFFDSMEQRPIRTGSWEEFEIVGDVHDDAIRITFGMILAGPGEAWLDDVVLEILGDAPPPVIEAPRPLTPRGLDNVVAFTRLLGFVRYFHPSDAAAEANWEWLAVEGMRRVESAADARELAGVLATIFTPVAPGLVIAEGAPPVTPTTRSGPTAPTSEVMAWHHFGVGMAGPHSRYSSTRLRLPATDPAFGDSLPAVGEVYVADLGGGVHAAVPLTVVVGAGGAATDTRPGHPTEAQPTADAFAAEDRATRLAAVALAWNVFQHFYPYFDVVPTDWAAELRRALNTAATDSGALEFLGTLRLLVAALQDGHGSVRHHAENVTHEPAFNWTDVDDRPVITVAEAGTGLRRGDVVLRIDGQPAQQVIAERERFISGATSQWRRFEALRLLLRGPHQSQMRLDVRGSDGSERSVTVARTGRAPTEPKPEPIAELRPGIHYVDIDRVTDAQLSAALPTLAAARGIIFDLRGYPRSNMPTLLAHLLTAPGTSPQWHIPVATRPDRTDQRFARGAEWSLTPASPHLGAPRVFITDGRAVSYAESTMGIVEHYRLGEIVGGATAGTNGNINPFQVPGGYHINWTGMKVLKHDGSVHHGVGNLPTVPMRRTVAGIAEGRDELLERALQILGATAH